MSQFPDITILVKTFGPHNVGNISSTHTQMCVSRTLSALSSMRAVSVFM